MPEQPAHLPMMANVLAMGGAHSNSMCVMTADRIGTERGQPFLGSSLIVSHTGWPLSGPASVDREEMLTADLRLAAVAGRRLNQFNDVLADRRPSIYGALASRQRPTRSVEASTGLRCTSVCRGARCLSGCGLALVRRSRMSCRRSPNIGADD